MNNMLNISSSPHARDKWSTAYIMRMVLLALLPATLVGVIHYGFHALLVILVSVATAVLCEFLFDKLCHKPDTWKDCSAVVTGLLLALCLSPSVPLHLPVLGSGKPDLLTLKKQMAESYDAAQQAKAGKSAK